jgi:hypothetical protein
MLERSSRYNMISFELVETKLMRLAKNSNPEMKLHQSKAIVYKLDKDKDTIIDSRIFLNISTSSFP